MKAVQYFTDEYLEQCKKMTPLQIMHFQESFRLLNEPNEKSKLISIRVPENLLRAFKGKCNIQSEKYQSKIKELMVEWINK